MFESKFHPGPNLDQRPRRGGLSPWGVIDDASEIRPGIWFVFTPSHGGLYLEPDALEAMPEPARSRDGWYEEDCEALLPFLFLGLKLKAVTREELAEHVRLWFKDYPEILREVDRLEASAGALR